MKLKLAPSLLLTVLQISSSAAFAPPSSSRATISTTHLYQYNEYYNTEYSQDDVHSYQQHPIYDEQNVDFSRRGTTGAFFRGLTAAGAVAAGSAVIRPWNANAAEFSNGGVVSSSSAPVQQAAPTAAGSAASAQKASPVKGNPAFPKFTPLKTPVGSTAASVSQYKNSFSEMDPNLLAAGTVTAAGLIGVTAAMDSVGGSGNIEADDTKADAPVSTQSAPAPAAASTSATPEKPEKEEKPWYQPPTPYGIVNKDQNPFAHKAQPVPATVAGAPPPLGAAPYGLAGGRNYWDNRVLQTAASLPKPPPKPTPTPPTPPEVDSSKDADKPWYQPPTPYGLVNKSGNPFLKDIQQYCEPGKVSEPCTDSIKGYLSDLTQSGKTATGEAASTIVGYLDSLGGKTPAGASAAPTTKTVKEALATGSTPPPASAEKVKDYLNALDIGKKPVATGMVMQAPPKSTKPISSMNPYESYDTRLTNIETRVESLEERVESLPDEVFDRMEQWRMDQENRWGSQFGSITGSSGSGGGYSVPPPPSPPQKLKVSVGNAPRGTGMGGYLESLNP